MAGEKVWRLFQSDGVSVLLLGGFSIKSRSRKEAGEKGGEGGGEK
jgi:hypothetical protein